MARLLRAVFPHHGFMALSCQDAAVGNGSVGDAKVNIGSAGMNQHDWNWNSSVEAAAVNAGKSSRFYLRLYLYGTKGTAWFDDVRLRELAD